jgi:hypothetical protein
MTASPTGLGQRTRMRCGASVTALEEEVVALVARLDLDLFAGILGDT